MSDAFTDPVLVVPPDGPASPSPAPSASLEPGGLPTAGWTVPVAPVAPAAPRIRGPVQGSKIMLGGGIAFGGHTLALVATAIVAFTGSVYDSTWLVIVGIEVLLFFACLVCGIVWVTSRDRGIGIGLLVGWPVGLLVPMVVIGFYVLGLMAPLSAFFEAEVP